MPKKHNSAFTMTIPKDSMWQTTAMDHAVAEELFGWRWLAYLAIPERGTTGYPKECLVRRFFPPAKEMHSTAAGRKRWEEYLAEKHVEPATGEEPLSYCYCSSNGPHMVPHFSGHEASVLEMEKEIHRRNLWDDYLGFLGAQVGSDSSAKLRFATCEQKCLAALSAVGSKYVTAAPEAASEQAS